MTLMGDTVQTAQGAVCSPGPEELRMALAEISRGRARMAEQKQEIEQLREALWHIRFIGKNRYYSDDAARLSMEYNADKALTPDRYDCGGEDA